MIYILFFDVGTFGRQLLFLVAYHDSVDYRDFAQHNGVTRKDLIDISFINETVWQVLVHF